MEHKSELDDAMDDFTRLFRLNSADKSAFMDKEREAFFSALARRLSGQDMLRLFFLEIDGVRAAGVMCFEYKSSIYIYNNGYDSGFSELSAGLISKIFSIEYGIKKRKSVYNFLKGDEPYKKRLGGMPVSLHNFYITL